MNLGYFPEHNEKKKVKLFLTISCCLGCLQLVQCSLSSDIKHNLIMTKDLLSGKH